MHKKESKLIIAAKTNKFEDLLKVFEKIDKAKAKRKLKENIDIDAKDSIGTTALHYAAKHGNIEMMKYLVSRGAYIESIDQNGWRPISYACANNNLDAVKTLIQWKSNVNKFSLMEENSPLHIAAGFGHTDIVKLLMENGAIVHHQNKKKQTAMEVACENNHYRVVNILLTASSKLVEDTTDKNITKNDISQSISPPLSKSSLFIKSPSINNSHHITSRMKSELQYNGDAEFKRRTIGSQSQLCTSPEKPTPKKSGSLNTVFFNDHIHGESNKKINEKERTYLQERKSNVSEIEVNLPYPSKFSTPEKLKIKSPLLATKNWKLDTKVRRNNPSIIETFDSDEYSAQFICLTEAQTSPSIVRIPSEKIPSIPRPLSSSCKIEKENLTKQTSMYSINNTLSPNSPSDTNKNLLSHFRKSQSVQRRFGSENDIVDSPNRKENNGNENIIKCKSITKTSYIKSPSLQNYVSSKIENNVPNENNFVNKNEDYTCSKWIKNLGLERIWDILFKEGFDSFLALSLATNEELLLLCDSNLEDWNNLKRNLDLLNIPSLNQLKFSTKISDLLFQLGLECYINNFYHYGCINTHQTLGFKEVNLNKLQIFKIGHRKLILKCLSILHNNENNISEASNSPFSLNDSPLTNIYDESKYFLNNRNSPIFKNDDEHDDRNGNLENSDNHLQLLNNLNEVNHCPVVMSKKPPPPIPCRSSSILELENSKNLTLNDIFSPSDKDIKKTTCIDTNITNSSSLDDIMNLLTNLGKELDHELNNV